MEWEQEWEQEQEMRTGTCTESCTSGDDSELQVINRTRSKD